MTCTISRTALRAGMRLGAAGLICVAAMAAGAATAQNALPDLRVNDDEMPNGVYRTEILAASCEEREPLARLRIAIENIGEADAKRSIMVGLKNIVEVQVLEAPFIEDNDLLGFKNNSANNIDALEIHLFDLEVGDNVRKVGRVGETVNDSGPPKNWEDQQDLPLDLRQAIQRALNVLGYDTNGTRGRFRSATRAAIENYQADIGASRTAVLTSDQIRRLRDDTKEEGLPDGYGLQQEFEILVVVDPDDRIEESDETNNNWRSGPIRIDCG